MRLKHLLFGLTALSGIFPGLNNLQAAELEGFYPNPGIVAYRNGQWVGSDHLYNLSNRIGVDVEIYKPKTVAIPLTEEMIRSRISDIFRKAKIDPIAESSSGKPPTPIFHMLVMVYPIEKGYAILCEGRLFELIHLDRIVLDEQTVLQGITWESKNLILSPSDQIAAQIYKGVDEIAKSFTSRFTFFETIKAQIKH